MTTFDHIVVGAGSAGCVLARRLLDAGRRVLVLEHGGADDHPDVRDVRRHAFLWGTDVDHAYTTEPQEHAGGRRLPWPRGRVLGGSGALNSMIAVRGHPSDYDGWGVSGWGWEDVRPAFERAEADPLVISDNDAPHPVSSAFLDAARAHGLAYDPHGGRDADEGVGLTRHFARDGRRISSFNAYLQPRLQDPDLTLVTGAVVHRVLVEGGRAVGVEYTRGGSSAGGSVGRSAAAATQRAYSDGDVVLCAGAIGSPQVLMLSGIGPAAELAALGIAVVADRPQVGANLHDHALVPVVWRAAQPVTPFTSQGAEVHFFARSDPTLAAPDIQPLMIAFPFVLPDRPTPEPGYACMAGLIAPRSRGRLWLRSPSAHDHPALDPQVLADPHDLDVLLTAVRLVREIGAGAALDPWRAEETAPGPDADTGADDAALAAYVRAHVGTYHHQAGTCRMGTDAGAVVDPHLRVRGVTGLRVADASVMPQVVSGNTHLPCCMIGERAAALVLDPAPLAALSRESA